MFHTNFPLEEGEKSSVDNIWNISIGEIQVQGHPYMQDYYHYVLRRRNKEKEGGRSSQGKYLSLLDTFIGNISNGQIQAQRHL